MPTLKEEVGVEKKKYFFCVFLNDDGYCLVEKKECPQDKGEKCKEVEDAFQ